MWKTISAFLLGAMLATAAILPTGSGPAAQEEGATGTFYYDMGTVHVQFEHEACGTRTLAVSYQIEYGDESKGTTITAYKPKIESYLFHALSEHLEGTQNTRPKTLQRVMARAVKDALGQGLSSDVLIMEVQVLDI